MKTIGQAGAEAALKAMDEIDFQVGVGIELIKRRAIAAALRSLSEQAYEREDALVVDMSDIYDIADELELMPGRRS